jgi:hypothetical protein
MKKFFPGMLLTALLPISPAMAAPCTTTSAAGIWSLVSIKAAEPGVEEFYKVAPHEVMRFTREGGFMYLASNRPIAPADAAARLDAADARDGETYLYSLTPSGAMSIVRNGTPFQAFQCDIADSNMGDARAGDLILTNVAGAAMVRRIERKLP